MKTQHPLSDIAEQYGNASSYKRDLEAAIEEDKKGRSLPGKIYDFIADTSSEKALSAYDKTFGRVHKEAAYRVDRWVDNNVMHQLKNNPDEFKQWKEEGEKLREIDGYIEGFNGLIKKGEKTNEMLRSAASSCTIAVIGEFFDAFSRSRGISGASAGLNSKARKEVRAALHSLNEFNDELGSDDPHKKDCLRGLGIDTAIDMVFLPGSDVFSALNAGRLHSAGDDCRKHAEKVKESLGPLYTIRNSLVEESNVLKSVMGEIEQKYKAPLQESIPQSLQSIVDPNDIVDYRTFIDSELRLTTNMNGANSLLKSLATDREKIPSKTLEKDSSNLSYG